MQKLLQLLIIIFTISLLPAQDVWGGVSVATPDNLDALSHNPAGLGLNRGNQSGMYIPFDSIFTLHSSSRSSGFGYDLKYEFRNGKFPDIFNPSDGNIGIGFSLFPNAYAGIKWNKYHLFDLGFLYRPFNFASIGFVTQFSEEFDYHHSTVGLAFRPLSIRKLTLGMDAYFYTDSLTAPGQPKDTIIFLPHLAISPFDGITISASTEIATDFKIKRNAFQINIAVNLGKQNIYGSTGAGENRYAGIGFYSDTQKQKSIVSKKDKDTKKFIRMKLEGLFIEENPITPPFNFDFNFSPFARKQPKGIQLRTWIEDIDKLAEDGDIDGLIIDMGSVRAGWAKRLEIRNALKRFQNKDKDIIVYADKGIGNVDYFLIAMANEIYVNNETNVWLKGLRIEVDFYKGLLDTLSIVPEVVRVNYDGKSYKTAMDPLLRKSMSDEMRENYGELLDDLNELFLDGVSLRFLNNKITAQEIINNGPYIIGEDILDVGLADSIMYPDQFDNYINSMNEEKVKIVKWEDIDRSKNYVHEWTPKKKAKIAIIYAVGGIVSGKSNPGPAGSSRMGHETINEAIKSAREDKEIKAIVMRIDSPGGSVFASDQMWREVLKTTEEDSSNVKPFIASMSDFATSGGYYIACQADTIIASPVTITASIGVFWWRPNFSQLGNRFGINTQWIIKEGEHSDFYTGARLFNEYEKVKIQSAVDEVYLNFKEKIINGRENINETDDLDQVAMGRIFSGNRAKDGISIPLVDVTGSFNDAIELAKSAAGISEEDEIEIVEYPKHKDALSDIFSKSDSKLQASEILRDILPKELSEQLEILDILPIIMDNELQMIIPYQITIE